MADWRGNLLEDEEKIRALLSVDEADRGPRDQDRGAGGARPRSTSRTTSPPKGSRSSRSRSTTRRSSEILGRQVYRKLADVPGDIDLVDVFRRPNDVPGHVEDLLAKRPRAVWMQLGIRNDEAAEALARAGILVVQDRCLMVDWRRLVAR